MAPSSVQLPGSPLSCIQTPPPPRPSATLRPPIYQPLSPLLFLLAGCLTGTSLPPCECVDPSSESPVINRYCSLSAKCKPFTSLLPGVGVALWFNWERIYSRCVYSCVLMHALRIMCYFSSCSSLLSASSDFISHCLTLISLLISPHLCGPPWFLFLVCIYVFRPPSYLCCTNMQSWGRKTLLFVTYVSRKEQKGEKKKYIFEEVFLATCKQPTKCFLL